MGNLSMLIEAPAWRGGIRVVWVDLPSLHDTDLILSDGTKAKYQHALAVVMHEFGHAAGLHDLYKYGEYRGYIMYQAKKQTAIPNKDKDFLRDVYRNHTPHPIQTP